ncbi:hypothetical protein SEA_ZIKO_95 [Gordonia phage Ziko]|uniref:Uncharacterized protein n=1 Tax=Gordonia phage Ziko TaxID=2591193 RepID=A0A514A5B6_9CAUD|nr:hypothetical protein SEA_ZIKO_95 [Gordonia phage Ziko]
MGTTEQEMRVCKSCETSKPINEFHKSGRYGDGTERRRWFCKQCSLKEKTPEAKARAEAERRRKISNSNRNRTKVAQENFIEDYTFLKEQGMSHEDIARSLDMKPDSLRTKCQRLGIPVALNPDQKLIKRQYELLVKKGKVFSFNNIAMVDPTPTNLTFWRLITNEGLKDNIIRELGTEKSFWDKGHGANFPVFVRADVSL